jgi:metal-responsive CopG/Arc/MetJ family transcriptional regulator
MSTQKTHNRELSTFDRPNFWTNFRPKFWTSLAFSKHHNKQNSTRESKTRKTWTVDYLTTGKFKMAAGECVRCVVIGGKMLRTRKLAAQIISELM